MATREVLALNTSTPQILAPQAGDTYLMPRDTAVVGLLDLSNASSGQIKFPATQNASADANTLDDYEEGTWTPVDASAASLTFTNYSGNCLYTKIGRLVTASFRIVWPSTVSSAATAINGLPYACSSTTDAVYGGTCSYATYSGIVSTFLYQGTAGFTLMTAGGVQLTNANMSTKEIRGVLQYYV